MRLLRAGLVRLLDWWLRAPLAVRLAAPIAVMVVLWLSSSRTPTPRPPSVQRALLHNGAHVVAYCALGAAWLLALLPSEGARLAAVSRRVIAAALALSVGYGVVDELHQSFVPGRHSSFWDVLCDALGAVLAVLLVLWIVSGERRFAARIAIVLVLAVAGVLAATFLP